MALLQHVDGDFAVLGAQAVEIADLDQALRHQQIDWIVFHQQHQTARLSGHEQQVGRQDVHRRFLLMVAGRLKFAGGAGQQPVEFGEQGRHVGVARDHAPPRRFIQFQRGRFHRMQHGDAQALELAIGQQALLQLQGALPSGTDVDDQQVEVGHVADRHRFLQDALRFEHGVGHVELRAGIDVGFLDLAGQDRVAGIQQHIGVLQFGRQAVAVADRFQHRDFKPERGAGSGLRIDADLSRHQIDDALADDQSQTGSAIQARSRGIGLAEGLEQAAGIFRRDADAGVFHFEAQDVVLAGFRLGLDRNRHGALVGELDGVAEQIAQYLAQTHRIASYGQTQRRIQVDLDAKMFGIGLALEHAHHRIDHVAQVHAGGFQLQLVGFQFRVIEDVVDDAFHLPGRAAGGAQDVGLVLRERSRRQQIQHRNDAVQRRADFMAHGRQEFTFGHGRRFGGQLGFLQLEFETALLFQFSAQPGHFLQMMFGVGFGLCDAAVMAFNAVPERRHERHRQQRRDDRDIEPDRFIQP